MDHQLWAPSAQANKQARRRSECCLNEVDLTPAASTTCERSAMLAHPSTELVVRAPCQLRRAHARSVRAARAHLRPPASRSARSAALRSTRRASATFKRGAPEAPSRGDDAGTFFLGGGFPVVNWGSTSPLQCSLAPHSPSPSLATTPKKWWPCSVSLAFWGCLRPGPK
jgi:hypothetical protein